MDGLIFTKNSSTYKYVFNLGYIAVCVSVNVLKIIINVIETC